MNLPQPIGSQDRRPLPAGTRELALLGEVLDVVVEGDEVAKVRMTSTTDMLWSEHAKALVFVPGRTFHLEDLEGLRGTASARAFERWSVWEATSGGRATLAEGGPWRRFNARTIGYRSDKFGRGADYEHDFGRAVVAYVPTSSGAPWVIRGGSLRLTARGIEG